MGLQEGADNLSAGIQRLFIGEHKRREQEREDLALLNTLSSLQLPDPKDPEKTKSPFNKETQELMQQQMHQKGGALRGSAEAWQRILPYMMHAAQQEPRIETEIGGVKLNLSQAQRAQIEMQKEAVARANEAAKEKAKLTTRREERADVGQEIAKEHLDIAKSGLKLRGEAGRQQWIQNQPETKLFNETGISPQFFMKSGSTEAGYIAKQRATGNTLAELDPINPGGKLNVPANRKGWEYFKQTFLKNRPSDEPIPDPDVEFVPKAGGTFRVKQYTYSASKDKPKETRYEPHPEGEFLQIGDKRVPYNDAMSVLGMIERRKVDAQKAISNLPLPEIKKRLDQLGYDSNDKYWGLPQVTP